MDPFFKHRLVGDSTTSIENIVEQDDTYFDFDSRTLRYHHRHVEDQFLIHVATFVSNRMSFFSIIMGCVGVGLLIVNFTWPTKSYVAFVFSGMVIISCCIGFIVIRTMSSKIRFLVKQGEEIDEEVAAVMGTQQASSTKAPTNVSSIEFEETQMQISREKRETARQLELVGVGLLATILLAASLLMYGDVVSTECENRFLNYVRDENKAHERTSSSDEMKTSCAKQLPRLGYALFLAPVVLKQPRFLFAGPLICGFFVCNFLFKSLGIGPDGNEETTDDLIYKLLIILATTVFSVILIYYNEVQFRNQFVAQAIYDARKEALRDRLRSTSSYINKILPRRLKNRLLQTNGKTDPRMIDVSDIGVVIVSTIHDVNIFTNQLLPTEAAVAISGLSSISVTLAQTMGLDHIKTVGDSNYVTCNLLRDCSHGAKMSVAYALALGENTSHLAVKSGVSCGKLVGLTVRGAIVRYDIFGPAFEHAQQLVLNFNKCGIVVSRSVAQELPPSALVTAPIPTRTKITTATTPMSSTSMTVHSEKVSLRPRSLVSSEQPTTIADEEYRNDLSSINEPGNGSSDHSGPTVVSATPANSPHPDPSPSGNLVRSSSFVATATTESCGQDVGFQLRSGLDSEDFIDENLKFKKKDPKTGKNGLGKSLTSANNSNADGQNTTTATSNNPAASQQYEELDDAEERLRQLIFMQDNDELWTMPPDRSVFGGGVGGGNTSLGGPTGGFAANSELEYPVGFSITDEAATPVASTGRGGVMSPTGGAHAMPAILAVGNTQQGSSGGANGPAPIVTGGNNSNAHNISFGGETSSGGGYSNTTETTNLALPALGSGAGGGGFSNIFLMTNMRGRSVGQPHVPNPMTAPNQQLVAVPSTEQRREQEERNEAKARVAEQQRQQELRSVRIALDHYLYTACCAFYAALSAILIGCITHSRWSSFDSYAIGSVIVLILCVCGWLFCWVLEYTQEGLAMRNALTIALSLGMISAVSLSRPSVPGNDLSWLMSLLLATTAISLFGFRVASVVQVGCVVVYFLWTFLFRPLVELGMLTAVLIQGGVLVYWCHIREKAAEERYENALKSKIAVTQMREHEEWRIGVLRATIPDPLVCMCREARLEGKFGLSTWSVGDVTVVSLQVKSFFDLGSVAGSGAGSGSNTHTVAAVGVDLPTRRQKSVASHHSSNGGTGIGFNTDNGQMSMTAMGSQRGVASLPQQQQQPPPPPQPQQTSTPTSPNATSQNAAPQQQDSLNSAATHDSTGGFQLPPVSFVPPGNHPISTASPNNSTTNSLMVPGVIGSTSGGGGGGGGGPGASASVAAVNTNDFSIASFVKQVETFTKDIQEFFDSQNTHNVLQVVKVFGGSILVAGPLEASAEPDDHVRAASEAFKLIESLLVGGHRFSAALTIEESVNVVQIADFPTFDMFGPAVSTAHALMVATPSEMVIATERLVKLQVDSGDVSNWSLKVGERERWRIRGKGSVTVHRISL